MLVTCVPTVQGAEAAHHPHHTRIPQRQAQLGRLMYSREKHKEKARNSPNSHQPVFHFSSTCNPINSYFLWHDQSTPDLRLSLERIFPSVSVPASIPKLAVAPGLHPRRCPHGLSPVGVAGRGSPGGSRRGERMKNPAGQQQDGAAGPPTR